MTSLVVTKTGVSSVAPPIALRSVPGMAGWEPAHASLRASPPRRTSRDKAVSIR